MSAPDALQLPEGRFAGVEAFRQCVRDALQVAVRDGWREMIWADPDFREWPLGERAVAELLQQWVAQPQRRLVVLAGHYDEIVRCHARFVTWRRTWSDRVECRRSRVVDPAGVPSALWSPAWALVRQDSVRSGGVCTTLPERRVALHEQLQEGLRLSSPSFAATTLGL